MKKLLTILLLGLAVTAPAAEKIYDPMDVFKRDVPPNIYVVVDNSGSMTSDTNNRYIRSYAYVSSIFPGLKGVTTYRGRAYVNHTSRFGSMWAYNEPTEYGLVKYGAMKSASRLHNRTTTFSLPVSATGKVTFVSLDICFDDVIDGVDALKYITSIKIIHPSGREVEVMDVITGKYNQDLPSVVYNSSRSEDTVKVGGKRYTLRHKFFRLALGGANVNDPTVPASEKYFRGLDKEGTWQVQITHTNSSKLYARAIRLGMNPVLSKVTVMKSVLHEVFRRADKARFAFGAYKTYWRSIGTQNLPDRTSANIYSYYAGRYDSAYFGSEMLEDFPADPLDTTGNRQDLLDWVNMDVNHANANQWRWGSTRPKEIFAVTWTPIGGTFRDAYGDLRTAMNADPSVECRNYSVIYLTDGYCTVGNCSDSYIVQQIDNIYRMHTVNKDLNGDGTIDSADFIPTPVYVIGFAMGTNSKKLNRYADAGHTDGNPDQPGNQAYMPSDAESLLQTFRDAIAAASTQTFTGESQVLSFKLDPDLNNKADVNGDKYLVWQERTDNAVLQSYFTYSDGDGFKGHLKAYGILKPDGTLLGNNQYRPLWDVSNWEEIPRDANGQPLASEPEPRPGTVDQRIFNIQRYLTPDPSNANYVGGPTSSVPFRESFRCIVTPSGISGGSLIYFNDYRYDNQAHRYLPSSSLVSFVQSRLGFDTVAETIEFIDFVQTKTVGDSTFSTPAIIGPPDSHYADDTYNTFEKLLGNRQRVIYIGANDGMLHCYDAHTGDELWAFIPYDLLPRMKKIWDHFKATGDLSGQPDPKGTNVDWLGRRPHYYYLASSPRYTDIKDRSGQWMTILTIGEGAGGNAYTTLNVTDPSIQGFSNYGAIGPANFYPAEDGITPDDPHDNPAMIRLAYNINNDNNLYLWSTAAGPFGNMGETWSTPAFVRQGKDTFVGYFGSGYPGYGGQGNTFYVVDLADGSKLDSRDLPGTRSIMCSPGALVGYDNTVYAVYFGDTKGGLWRYIPDLNTIGTSTLDKIFQSTYNTTIFDTPALMLDSNGIVWVSTGEMGEEAGTQIVDNSVLYTVKDDAGYDQHPAPVYTAADMVDLNAFEASYGTNTVVTRSDVMGPNDKGYFYQLPTRETLFTSPIITGYTLNQLSYVTTLYLTYQYPAPGNYCSLGDAHLYIFGLSSLFISDEEGDGDGANLVGEGKPGSPFESDSGEIWLNTPAGPVRVINAKGQGLGTGSASQDINAQDLGRSGGWFIK